MDLIDFNSHLEISYAENDRETHIVTYINSDYVKVIVKKDNKKIKHIIYINNIMCVIRYL